MKKSVLKNKSSHGKANPEEASLNLSNNVLHEESTSYSLDFELTDEEVKELQTRLEDYKQGKTKGYTLEEIEEELRRKKLL